MTTPRRLWDNKIVAYTEMAPQDLIPNPKNWRVHPDAQRLALSGALDEIGWIQPVIYNRQTNRLVDGHLRRDLALLRDEPTIPVTVVDLTPEEESKALATIDPLSAMAQSDDTLLLNLLATIQTADTALSDLLDDLMPIAPGVSGLGGASGDDEDEDDDEPDFDETQRIAADWNIQPGELWEIPSATSGGAHRLLCGDATDGRTVERLLHGRRGVLLATDPPYGVAFEGAKYNPKAKEWASIQGDERQGVILEAWLTEVWRLWLEYLHPRGVVYCWAAILEEGYAALRALTAAGLHVQSQIMWSKNTLSLGQADYQWKHENCWYAFRKGSHHFWYGGRKQTSVWEIPKDGNRTYLHPMQKPVALFTVPIENHSKPGELVLEPFAGSGSQFLAAEQTGRICYGTESDPTYVAVTLERLRRLGLQPVCVGDRSDATPAGSTASLGLVAG